MSEDKGVVKVFKEFREFIVRGNAIDLAVGVIFGAAFGKIIDSLVKDVIMPPIGMLAGKVDFTNLFVVLQEGKSAGPYSTLDAAQKAGAVTMNLGLFINVVVNFIIIAFALFMMVKAVNKMRKPVEAPAAGPTEVDLLTEIRDALKK